MSMNLRAGLFAVAVGAVMIFAGGVASAASSIRAVPVSVTFGERVVDMEYSSRYLDVDGTGPSMVEVTDAVLEGADADQFELVDYDCVGSEVDENTPCYMTINFDPTTVGAKSASIKIDTDTGDPLSVPLAGNGVELAPNSPDLAAPNLSEPIADTNDLRGFAGGDFQGEGRSGVISISQMDDWSIGTSFAYGQSDGLLSAPFGRNLAAGGAAHDAITGDFDGDGDIDGAGSGGGTIVAYFNDGSGGMTAGTELPVDPENGVDGRLASGDFTGDGIEDILSGYGNEDGYMLQIFPGNEEGTFEEPIAQQTAIDSPMGLADGDFNADGMRDFAASTYDGFVYMYLGDGEGGFTEVGKFGAPDCGCQSPWGIDTGDLNGDGLDDVVSTMRFQDELAVYLAQSDGTFVRGQRIDVPLYDSWNPNPYSVSIGDLNGDAKPDLISGNYLNDTASVYVGKGDGAFSLGENLILDAGFAPHGTLVGDFNGDGKSDPSAASQEGTVAVYLNQGEPGQTPVPSSVDFGAVETGTDSAPKTVKLENQDGLAELRVDQVSIGGGDSNDFEIVGGDCLSAPVPVGDSCEVQIRFTPVGPTGNRESSLFLDTNNKSESRVSVKVFGIGSNPTPPVVKAPKVIIKKRPKAKIKIKGKKLKKARIAFRSDQSGAKFKCRVDKKKFRSCKSPLVLRGVKPGKHVVRIKATKSGKTGPVKLVKFKVIRLR